MSTGRIRIGHRFRTDLKFAIRNCKFAILVGALLLALCLPAQAQQAKIAKIGWLGFRSASDPSPGREALKKEFRRLGYLEGKNIFIERRSAEGKLDRLPGMTDELVRLRVDAIVAPSTPSALAA